MPVRLIIALALSLVLHGSLLLAALDNPSLPSAPTLQASLRMPPELEKIPEPPLLRDTLLKNTIEDERPAKPAVPVPPRPKETSKSPRPAAIARREMEVVRKKLSEYVFYPEQARKLGLEGTVKLFVEFSEDGRVEDVRVAASSGFPILDNAAIRAAYAMGRLPGISSHGLQQPIPVVFRLE